MMKVYCSRCVHCRFDFVYGTERCRAEKEVVRLATAKYPPRRHWANPILKNLGNNCRDFRAKRFGWMDRLRDWMDRITG